MFFCSILCMTVLVSSAFALEKFDKNKYSSIKYSPLKYLYYNATKGSLKGCVFGSTKQTVLKKAGNPTYLKNFRGRTYFVYLESTRMVTLVLKKNRLQLGNVIYFDGENPTIKLNDVKRVLGTPNSIKRPNKKQTETCALYGNIFSNTKKVQLIWNKEFDGYFISAKMTGKEYLRILEHLNSVYSKIL